MRAWFPTGNLGLVLLVLLLETKKVTAVALATGRLSQPTSAVTPCPQLQDHTARARGQPSKLLALTKKDQNFTFL